MSLAGASLTGNVLDTLATNSVAMAYIGDALNTELRVKLLETFTGARLPNLARLVETMQPADLVASKDLSVQAFVAKQVAPIVANDPALKQAVDLEIGTLSDSTTVEALLHLDTPIQEHPLFRADVMKANIASLLATSPRIAINHQLQSDFISRYADSTGSISDFWKDLSSDPKFQSDVPELQFTLQLGALTRNNAPLVAALREQFQPK